MMSDNLWEIFKIEDLFDIKIGPSLDGNKLELENGKIQYITRKTTNNGLEGFINLDSSITEFLTKNDRIVITIGNETAKPFVQVGNFFTGTKVNILTPRIKVSYKCMLFIANVLEKQTSFFTYSYTINSTRLKKQYIPLPVDSNRCPDWNYMENYIEEREDKSKNRIINFLENELKKLENFEEKNFEDIYEWKEFKLSHIFSKIQRGKRLVKDNQSKGLTPYVSSTSLSNGVDNYISEETPVKNRMFQNVITIANSGSVGETFYHPYKFIASDHVTALESDRLNEHIAMFLKSSVSKIADKYSFNREINDYRINNEKIMLPATINGEPDYDFMENYMKKLKYDQIKKVLRFLNKK